MNFISIILVLSVVALTIWLALGVAKDIKKRVIQRRERKKKIEGNSSKDNES